MKLLCSMLLAFAAFAFSSPAGAQSTASFRIAADTVTNGENPGVQGVPCVNESIFFPGDVIVFRAVVLDGATGVPLTQEQIQSRGITAVVSVDGRSIPMRFGPHPPPFVQAPKRAPYWSGTLSLTTSHPTGTLPWTLTVSDNSGAKTTYTPIGQDAGISVLTVAQKK